MDEARAIILAMTDQAIHDWSDGTEEPTFPTQEFFQKPLDFRLDVSYNYV